MTITGKIKDCTYTVEFHKDLGVDLNTAALAVRAAIAALLGDIECFDNPLLRELVLLVNGAAIIHKLRLNALIRGWK